MIWFGLLQTWGGPIFFLQVLARVAFLPHLWPIKHTDMIKEHSIDLGDGQYLVVQYDGGWDDDGEPGPNLWQADIMTVTYETPEADVDISYLLEVVPQFETFLDDCIRNNKTHA